MLQKFIEFSEKKRLFTRDNIVLLAVSGGIDSMVMAQLFREARINHGVAHCNFSLRGEESDGDETFVRAYAEKYSIPYFSITFDTLGYASVKGVSLQMAARDLRYQWFSKVIDENGFDAVAVAHNLNDSIETFFINLFRGTGLNGLTGISPRNGIIIRPLLFASRDEITRYAKKKKIEYREDSSNADIKYIRNRIRHKVLPKLDEITGNPLAAISETISHLNYSAEIIENHIQEVRQRLFHPAEDSISVDVEALRKLQPAEGFIFELFRHYGLSTRQTGELTSLFNSPSGKYMYTSTHCILKDRNRLIITEKKADDMTEYQFHSIDEMRISGLFSDVIFSVPVDEPLPSGRLTACIDLALLKFPLTIRQWIHGDRFCPLGMSGFKKISDFLIDIKVPVTSKDKVRLLLSSGEVVWVMGYRLDNRFRVTEATERILILSL